MDRKALAIFTYNGSDVRVETTEHEDKTLSIIVTMDRKRIEGWEALHHALATLMLDELIKVRKCNIICRIPVGMDVIYRRTKKDKKFAEWYTYNVIHLDYVPAVEDYFDRLEEETERMTHMSNLYNYGWTTKTIYQDEKY